MPTIMRDGTLSMAGRHAAPAGCRQRILVVEDDAALRELELSGLQLAGYDTAAARDGLEAMERMSRETFDVVLLDILMPAAGGLRFLEWLRHEQSASVPVIVYTGHHDPALARRVQQAGATRLLWKPLCLDQLVAAVRSVLAT